MRLVSPLSKIFILKSAELYAEVFANKILIIIGQKKTLENLLRRGLNPIFAIGVVDDIGNLLGKVGFKFEKIIVNIDKIFFEKHFPKISA